MPANHFPTPLALQHVKKSGPHHRQSGFSLVEVLISILVMSFGLLGLVGLQATALQSNREARLQSVGIKLAGELAEMMRGNKSIANRPPDDPSRVNPYLVKVSNADGTNPLAPGTTAYCLNVGSAACTDNTAVANAQMTDWLARVDAELPGARVVVCTDSAPFDISSGLPQWDCTASTTASVVIKIGWTRSSLDRSKKGADAYERSDDTGIGPSIVLSISPGSPT